MEGMDFFSLPLDKELMIAGRSRISIPRDEPLTGCPVQSGEP